MKQRNKMKWLLGFLTGTVLCILPSNVTKAADVYTVTIRPGGAARFSDSFIQRYQSMYGAEVTEKVGSIKVKVPAGGTIPMLPNNSDLVYKEDTKGRYIMNTSWYPERNVIDGNESFVVKYDALVNEAAYKIRYVDSQSEKDIAPPVITQGNVGQTYTYYSEKIENYACETDKQSITLSENADKNVLIFSYTSTQSPIIKEVVTEENNTEQHQVNERENTKVTVTENHTNEADREEVNTEIQDAQTETEPAEIENEEAGQAEVQEETIEEENVPLANKTLEKEKNSKQAVGIMIFAALAVGICFYIKRRKQQLK